MNSLIKLIIFDCDGTLVDSEPITNRVISEYVAEFGIELSPKEALKLFVGKDMPGIVKSLEARFRQDLPAEFVPEFRRRQADALRADLVAFEGAEELLSSISVAKCLASNAPRDKIEINLSTTGLGRFFQSSEIFSAYDIQKWKPDPDLFLMAAAKMKVSPEECLVIEDSQAGIAAAKSANMKVVCFTNGKLPFDDSVSNIRRLVQLKQVLEIGCH